MNPIVYIFFGITFIAIGWVVRCWVRKTTRNAMHEMMNEYIRINKEYYREDK